MIVNNMARKQDNNSVNVVVRGVTAMALAVKSNVHLIEGRMFTPGLYELVVGKQGARAVCRPRRRPVDQPAAPHWTVVGVFDADGSGFESEIWGDLEVMGPAFNRSNGYQSLTLRLKNPSDVEHVQRRPAAEPERCRCRCDVRAAVLRQPGRRRAQALLALAVFVAVVMGIGAVFGAMNTMYGIVAHERARSARCARSASRASASSSRS